MNLDTFKFAVKIFGAGVAVGAFLTGVGAAAEKRRKGNLEKKREHLEKIKEIERRRAEEDGSQGLDS